MLVTIRFTLTMLYALRDVPGDSLNLPDHRIQRWSWYEINDKITIRKEIEKNFKREETRERNVERKWKG
ncbi:hypothetical protein Tco_0702383 [Tanacetum coccineum]|uniref:Uncharacterized protein n=1 Tax=Tanacetum coccineum TaxID=301880 RepID=A0ABQ4XWL9_9ASTR